MGTSQALMETEGQARGAQGLSLLSFCHFQSLLLGEGSAVCLTPWRPASWQQSPVGIAFLLRGPPEPPRRSCQEALRRWALCWCPALPAVPASGSYHPQITPILTSSPAASTTTGH